jgi:hypothetical protein
MTVQGSKRILAIAAWLVVIGVCADVIIAQCPPEWSLTAQRTKLYLYFAGAQDSAFPEYDPDAQTSPLEPFDVADLDSTIGTTGQLRDAILNIVKEDYCEFDVEIVSSTTAPNPTEARWQVVGLGTDSEMVGGGNLFGVAQDVDLNDVDAQDFARVYARSFRDAYGAGTTEPALSGASSTLQRWATAIGHTASHEAGHNFGLTHGNSAARTGEDVQNNHIMATGSTGLTGEMRAGTNRHFSDTSYEILGHNLGLRVKTLHNWDFINPNAQDAHSMVLTLLSPASALTLNWSYNGSTSPWTNPTLASAGTQTFRGTVYNRYTLTFSTPKAWSGGANGIVPGGGEFHTGASFAQSDPVLVFETRLRNAANANLNLHPRMVGFNAGTADLSNGDFNLTAFSPDGGPMVIENLQVQFLPRMLSLENMIVGAKPLDVHGLAVAQRAPGESFRRTERLEVNESTTFRLARFSETRPVEFFNDARNCTPGFIGGGGVNPPIPGRGPGDAQVGEKEYCADGWSLSLFPSTYIYVVATVVDPNVQYWDRAQGQYVTGPLRSRVFYQFAGVLPDFNRNGIDDLIDIRTNTSPDENMNGIVDTAEPGGTLAWWWWLILFIFFLLVLWLLFRRRRHAHP